MSEEKKRDIAETVDLLKGLDKSSLLLVKAGAQMLKARQDMEARGAKKVRPEIGTGC